MDMSGGYACLSEAVCDVTTVPSHLKLTKQMRGIASDIKKIIKKK